MFSFDARRSAEVVSAVQDATDVPAGAKLSPDTPDIVGVAAACVEAGADFLVLTNTARGFGLSLADSRPLISGGVGGYSGPGLKPLSLRCVYEVAQALTEVPIVGCGGVSAGTDVVEYLMAGASAVELGTVHFAEPSAGRRILRVSHHPGSRRSPNHGERSLAKPRNVLVMQSGGSTPVINRNAGRGHWTNCMSMLVAGGGTRGGQVIGATDRKGYAIAERPVRPADLAATTFRHLDIDVGAHWTSLQGRPTPIVTEGGQVIEELF
jgi:hypothetical protein